MNRPLSPENEVYLEGQVACGTFASRDEAIDAGVTLLRKRESLIQKLQESRRQLDSGEFIDHDDESLAARFEELKTKASSRLRS